MKRSKKRWAWTRANLRKTQSEKVKDWYSIPNWFRKETTKNQHSHLKPFFDENYIHPCKTAKSSAKWIWW